MRLLDRQAVEDIALGAAVLGTGGGGDPHVGKLMALQAIAENGPVKLIDIDDVADDAIVVPSAMMGAPTVLVEKVPGGNEMIAAFEALRKYLGRPVFATTPIEAGGLNSMIPLALGATLGLPVVDADGMGRAFPELQMVTFHLAGVSATPMVLADEKGNTVLLNTINNFWTESLARNATIVMGGSTMIAIYPMTGRQFKRGAIRGVVTLAENIGRSIREAQGKKDPIETVLSATGGVRLFDGKVTDVSRKTETGFARGEARVQGLGGDEGAEARVRFQNEHLIVTRMAADGNGGDTAGLGSTVGLDREEILASVPDLIAVLDAETGRPITTEALRYGNRITIIGIPCNEKWRTAEALAVVGPRYFGYHIDYVPVEKRAEQRRRRAG